ncbi:MAG TPA: glutaredoxin domain-containing protein [Cyclobacteriaceae bacterium]|nr:glutaredoxin domain-containing protein [Cyclobacteriaceae bacterium]
MNHKSGTLWVLMLCIAIGCSSGKNENKDNRLEKPYSVIVYGSRDCLHCAVFVKSLDSAGINYRFCEVDKDKSLFNEMYRKIREINYPGYVVYPVVDVNGKILVNPEFKDIAGILY